MVSKKIYLILWFLCILGSLSVFPYIYYLGILPKTVSVTQSLLFNTLQATFIYGLICWLSSKIVPRTDLDPFTKPSINLALFCGVLVGIMLIISDKFLVIPPLVDIEPPLWSVAIASFYGGINEEVFLRLFLFSFIYFTFRKCLVGKRLLILWMTTIIVAIIFGLGHLPALFRLTDPSYLEILRVIFLNGIAGIVFGWLYWSRGLWSAMIAHFVADLVIHFSP